MSFLKRSWDIKPLSTKIINKGYIPLVENSYNLLVGEGGSYKSFYALKSAVIYLLDNPDKNAFLALKEDGINENKRRLLLVCNTMNGVDAKEINKRIFWNTVEEDKLLFVTKSTAPILNIGLLSEFMKDMILGNVGFIVLDTLKRMHMGLQENDSTDMQLLVNGVFNEIPPRTNATLLVVHHSAKGDGSAVRGSGSISDDSRLTWALSVDVEKNKMTGKIMKKENVDKVKLNCYKENGMASKHCKIRDKNGYISLPFSESSTSTIQTVYQDKSGRHTSSPTPILEQSFNTDDIPSSISMAEETKPTLTISHKMAVNDYEATSGFKVQKMELTDFVDMNCNINLHYSPIQWNEGYRKSDNYISYEDFICFDFDDGMTISEAHNLFKKYNGVIMPTKSHQVNKNGLVCDRFRIVIPYIEPMKLNAEDSRLVKQMIYKEVGADIQVASASTKFRGSPPQHQPEFLKGKELFNWESYLKIVRIEQDRERYEREAKRLQGTDFSDLDDPSKIKALQTKFNTIYQDGNRNNAVANIVLFGKSMNLDFPTIERVVDGLVSASGNPLPQREMQQILKYHARN